MSAETSPSGDCPAAQDLYDLGCGQLRGLRRDEIEEHIGGCHDCQDKLEGDRALDEAVRQAIANAVPPDVLARMTSTSEATRRYGDARPDNANDE